MRHAVALPLALVAVCAPLATAKLFGFMWASINDNPNPFGYSNVYHTWNMLDDAVPMKLEHGIGSFPLVTSVFFDSTPIPGHPGHIKLTPDPNWQNNWNQLADVAAPLVANGTIIGWNLGDELMNHCVTPAQIQEMAAAIHARFPRGTPGGIVWYNEGGDPFLAPYVNECGQHIAFSLGPDVDLISTDLYHVSAHR